jgi:hypothetical protein
VPAGTPSGFAASPRYLAGEQRSLGRSASKFLQGKNNQRIAVCRALGHPTDGGNAVKQLATELDETWKTVASRFELNAAVSICHQGKYPSLTISSLEKLEEPQPLILLNSRVRQLVPLLI